MPSSPTPPPSTETAPDTHNLSVVSPDRSVYEVTFVPDDGSAEIGPCNSPCVLRARAGGGALRVRGAASYDQHLVLPNGDSNITLKKSCVSCYVWGGLLLAGAVSSGIALAKYTADKPDCSPYSGDDLAACSDDRDRFTIFQVVYGVGTVLFASVGIAALASGGRTHAELTSDARTSGNPRWVGASLRPLAGGGAAGSVRFSF
jgi:hypothetical protein